MVSHRITAIFINAANLSCAHPPLDSPRRSSPYSLFTISPMTIVDESSELVEHSPRSFPKP